MTSRHPRYSIIETLAHGDYATVYRGRDSELDREIAIKQIHSQYLDDPRRLQRYWQEAQLIAGLQHPRIMTIHDIIRDRGWLILELMQGDIPQLLAGSPIDLKSLRLLLISVANALSFLESKGILHGDVKPTNILMDKTRHVKLGDFGIARRLARDEGSVIKGTTKYMAPEVLSDQFGEVGPHSDLYSLGFSAYELMCGENFESLFPGLSMFGRDRQIAWMMWHSAADRRLPEIHDVLEGVPPDLARIVQRLCEKDPAKRYRSANELLDDLKSEPVSDAEVPGRSVEPPVLPKRRRRFVTYAAVAVSLLLCLVMAFIPGPSRKPVAGQPTKVAHKQGILVVVDQPNKQLVITTTSGEQAAVPFLPESDLLLLNKEQAAWEDLQQGDELSIDRSKGVIHATRPIPLHVNGTLTQVDAAAKTIAVSVEGSSDPVPPLKITSESLIKLNGGTVVLSALHADDSVVVDYLETKGGCVVQSVTARRLTTIQAVLTSIDGPDRISLRTGPAAALAKLTIAADCQITINGLPVDDRNKPFSLADLIAGDTVAVTHHLEVVHIDAARESKLAGTVERIDMPARLLRIARVNEPAVDLRVPVDCVVVTEKGDSVELPRVRAGDQVMVELDSQGKSACRIQVVLAPDRRNWAMVIASQQYGDPRIPQPATVGRDAELLRDVLARQGRVADDQLFFKLDAPRRTLEQSIPLFLSAIPEGGRLIVYLSTHMLRHEDGTVYLAAPDFDATRVRDTGLELSWLIKLLDGAPAAEKTLLVGGFVPKPPFDLLPQPAVAELLQGATFEALRVIASCDAGNQEHLAPDGQHSLFAEAAAQALRGTADVNLDGNASAEELFQYLKERMAQRQQVPVFVAATKAARLSPETQAALRGLLHFITTRQFDNGFEIAYQQAVLLSPDQPDAHILHATALLKDNRRAKLATKDFTALAAAKSPSVVVHHALAWLRLRDDDRIGGMESLRQAISNIQDPTDPYSLHLFDMAGRLLAFVQLVGGPQAESDGWKLLGQAMAQHGEDAKTVSRTGYERVKAEYADYEKQEAENPQKARLLAARKSNLTTYMDFDFATVEAHLESAIRRQQIP